MRVSEALTRTLREAPRDAEGGNHELLVRGGYIRQLTAGVFSYLPLGNRVLRKIAQIVREEMDRIGGQEVSMPVLQPRDLWERPPAEGGPSRAETVDVLFNLRDRRERELVLGPTHEEVVTQVAKEFVRSYRDLPQLIYQIQTKFRDEPRPRGGLLRVREFMMKDLYSFDADQEGLELSYQKLAGAYQTIFRRCGLEVLVVEADSGAIGGKESQEFIALTSAGEDDVLLCSTCGYAANREKAAFVRETSEQAEVEAPLEERQTPGVMTIADLTAFLGVPAVKTLKAVCYSAGGRLILVCVRGDLEINDVKLTSALYHAGLNASDLHLATPEELASAGIVAGYTSPLDKTTEVLIIADHSLRQARNLVAGANRVDYHLLNINYPRDYRVDLWEDLASAYDGATCVICGGTLHMERGSEVGHIFKPGTRYSEPFGASYLDRDGVSHFLQMGTYGIGIGRAMAVAIEQHRDERGIIWPISIAPYQVALLGLDLEKSEQRDAAEKLYIELTSAGVEVLYDDRLESAGVKFNDADLQGLPWRAVVSKRSLKQGGVELKARGVAESRIVPLEQAAEILQEEIQLGLAALV